MLPKTALTCLQRASSATARDLSLNLLILDKKYREGRSEELTVRPDKKGDSHLYG